MLTASTTNGHRRSTAPLPRARRDERLATRLSPDERRSGPPHRAPQRRDRRARPGAQATARRRRLQLLAEGRIGHITAAEFSIAWSHSGRCGSEARSLDSAAHHPSKRRPVRNNSAIASTVAATDNPTGPSAMSPAPDAATTRRHRTTSPAASRDLLGQVTHLAGGDRLRGVSPVGPAAEPSSIRATWFVEVWTVQIAPHEQHGKMQRHGRSRTCDHRQPRPVRW